MKIIKMIIFWMGNNNISIVIEEHVGLGQELMVRVDHGWLVLYFL
jgi:hypothetical protein